MFVPTIVMAILAVVALGIAYTRGNGLYLKGLNSAIKMMIEILPLLFFAFVLAGLVQVLIPHETISKWIGDESGMRGIFIGTLAGAVTPGGPYVSLPLVAGFLKSGAGVGTMVAFLTGWSLWAISRLPLEIGIMGWRFTLARFSCTFIFPVIAGFLAQALFSGFK